MSTRSGGGPKGLSGWSTKKKQLFAASLTVAVNFYWKVWNYHKLFKFWTYFFLWSRTKDFCLLFLKLWTFPEKFKLSRTIFWFWKKSYATYNQSTENPSEQYVGWTDTSSNFIFNISGVIPLLENHLFLPRNLLIDLCKIANFKNKFTIILLYCALNAIF